MSRIDLNVYNEATGFMIASKGLGGRDFSEVEADDEVWNAAVEEGIFLPFSLVQDDPFVIRVVLDEPLSAEESAEWVGVSRHRLRVDDGILAVIGGGPEYLWGEDMDEFTRFLEIPPGDYLAEVYTYLQGVNGPHCLDAAGPDEPLGTFFRRTHPGRPFPPWLRNDCADDPGLDPGHEEQWEDAEADDEADFPLYVDFLLRLTPLVQAPESPRLENGWFPESLGARKPDRCPIGLIADEED